mmetsp:Transcript_4794/g.7294  ORF Transcript_4794/g.7294 Transcript_4794/m.7294 type:complete len:538 (-) Transcript_4794:151-1764(-)
MIFLSISALLICGLSTGSVIWTPPELLDINTDKHIQTHIHTKSQSLNLSSITPFIPTSKEISQCPDTRPNDDSVEGMYSAHRVKAVTAIGAKPGDVLVLFGGELEFREGSDTEILFRQISSIWYMANLDMYNCVLMITVGDNNALNATALVERQTRSQDIFNGFLPPMEELAEGFAVDYAAYVDELPSLLDAYLQSSSATPTVYTDDESKLESLVGGVPLNINTAAVGQGIDAARCVKDDVEVELLRHASHVAAVSHLTAWMATAEDNTISELTLEASFVEASQSCGMRFQAYIPIVAAGKNGAVLHYYKATANAAPGELILLDASPEDQGYCSDITRTYPVSGVFSSAQKVVYDIVLASADAGIAAMKAGADWNIDVCYGTSDAPGAYWALTQALLDAGFVYQNQATVEQLVFGDSSQNIPRVWSTFLPHSLGHGVGLNVHDMGATYSSCSSILEPGYVMTVEPGVYFIDELMDEACNGPDAYWYNCELIYSYSGFGGVRIEDVVAIGSDGTADCLSCSIPRTTQDIEETFAGFSN